MDLRRLTPIDGEAILPLDDAKEHLRVRHSDEDSLIGALRDAACEYIERLSGVALASADFIWEADSFARISELPMRPVTAIVEVGYLDSAGAAQTYDDARLVDGKIVPAVNGVWPLAYGQASVTFTAGQTCPPTLLAAVKLMLGHLYEHREASASDSLSEIPLGVEMLIHTHRWGMV